MDLLRLNKLRSPLNAMANRPVFIPIKTSTSNQMVEEKLISFKWAPGYAVTQKQINIVSLHEAAKVAGIGSNLLEVSTKSKIALGREMSAFNLKLNERDAGQITVESAFQGSKKFERGGPYRDLYGKSGKEIKGDERIKESGRLVGFDYEGCGWSLEPKTLFYDWLYINGLNKSGVKGEDLSEYDGFTDIEFNPKKSINCQARSCALYVALYKRGLLNRCLSSREQYIETCNNATGLRWKPMTDTQSEFNFG